jgi:TolB-like protein
VNKIISCVCVCLFFSLSACAGPKSSETKQVKDLPEISCVAVLPVGVPVSVSGTLTKANKQSLIDGAAFLDSLLMELDVKSEFRVLSSNQLDAILSNPWGGRVSQIADIGHATHCGGVLETSLSRYRQRVGNEMSAEVSASVAFSMELLGVKSGTVLWSTSFDETQKALFDDIFSFSKAEKRGFKWVSVEELCSDALKNRLAEFPYFNEEEI